MFERPGLRDSGYVLVSENRGATAAEYRAVEISAPQDQGWAFYNGKLYLADRIGTGQEYAYEFGATPLAGANMVAYLGGPWGGPSAGFPATTPASRYGTTTTAPPASQFTFRFWVPPNGSIVVPLPDLEYNGTVQDFFHKVWTVTVAQAAAISLCFNIRTPSRA